MADDKSKKSQVVTAPLVSVKDPGGHYVYLYRGANVDGYPAAEVKRLADLGLVGDADEDVVPGVGVHPSA